MRVETVSVPGSGEHDPAHTYQYSRLVILYGVADEAVTSVSLTNFVQFCHDICCEAVVLSNRTYLDLPARLHRA